MIFLIRRYSILEEKVDEVFRRKADLCVYDDLPGFEVEKDQAK